MDPLTSILAQRAMQQPTTPQAPQQLAQTDGMQPQPAYNPSMPPTIPTRIPPKIHRFDNANRIQEAYKNNWTPNPILLRATLGNH